jgi:hypothetical protein
MNQIIITKIERDPNSQDSQKPGRLGKDTVKCIGLTENEWRLFAWNPNTYQGHLIKKKIEERIGIT